jgi:hypothetical protein
LNEDVERVCREAVDWLRDAGVAFVEADLECVLQVTKAAAFPIALYELGVTLPHYLVVLGTQSTSERRSTRPKAPTCAAY